MCPPILRGKTTVPPGLAVQVPGQVWNGGPGGRVSALDHAIGGPRSPFGATASEAAWSGFSKQHWACPGLGLCGWITNGEVSFLRHWSSELGTRKTLFLKVSVRIWICIAGC
jgi:hypothetical protein